MPVPMFFPGDVVRVSNVYVTALRTEAHRNSPITWLNDKMLAMVLSSELFIDNEYVYVLVGELLGYVPLRRISKVA